MYIIYNRKTGKKQNKLYKTIQEAIKEAKKLNILSKNYNYLVTNLK